MKEPSASTASAVPVSTSDPLQQTRLYVIVAAQVIAIFRTSLPVFKNQAAANDMAAWLDQHFIDVSHHWEAIQNGELTPKTINSRRTQLKKAQSKAEHRYFPHGIPENRRLIQLASQDARVYFEAHFS